MNQSRPRGNKQENQSSESNIDALIYKKILDKFKEHKTIRLSENDSCIKECINNYKMQTKLDEKELLESVITKIMRNPASNIEILNDKKIKRNGEIVTIREFQKKIPFKNEKPPKNIDELKDDIRKWTRMGMSDPKQVIEKSGFKREHDFDHTYKEIEEDVEKLVEEGYLIEFKDNDDLIDHISKENKEKKKENEKQSSLLYPVDVQGGPTVELRGTHNQANYPQESLFNLSQLFNDNQRVMESQQKFLGEEDNSYKQNFDWKKIYEKIYEQQQNYDWIDEQEYTHYEYNQQYNESDDDEPNDPKKKDRRGGVQKNEHLKDKWDFMVNF